MMDRMPSAISPIHIDFSGPNPLIEKKKVILKNDYIHHVVDVYHV